MKPIRRPPRGCSRPRRGSRWLACGVLACGVLAAALATGCTPPRQVAAPGTEGAAGPATAAHCTLRPTGGLRAVTMRAPGPSGPAMARTYRLYVPSGIGRRGSVPLLVSLHGLGSNGWIQNLATGWSAFDDASAAAGSPFILVLPDGWRSLWFWGAERSYDVRFIFDLIARMEATGCVDPRRIYLDGWSEGAFMAQRMACANGDPAVDPRRIALAGVASYAGGSPAMAPDCGPGDRPVWPSRVLVAQGLSDTLVSATGVGFPGFTAWAARFGCEPAAGGYGAPQRLTGCRPGAAVAWWPIRSFGHVTWSCPADRFWHNRGIWRFLTRGVAPRETTCR